MVSLAEAIATAAEGCYARYDARLPVGSFQALINFFQSVARLYRRCTAEASFEACRLFQYVNAEGSRAQIIDNLVGCSKKHFVRTLSTAGRIKLNYSNESLIPAQNQRWRRA